MAIHATTPSASAPPLPDNASFRFTYFAWSLETTQSFASLQLLLVQYLTGVLASEPLSFISCGREIKYHGDGDFAPYVQSWMDDFNYTSIFVVCMEPKEE